MSKNKTDRKNKTNLNLEFPKASYFTIEELHRLNAEFVNITLRVRLMKAIEAGEVIEIGNKTGGQGRPKKVFALTPVAKETFEEAKGKSIVLISGWEKMVNKSGPFPVASPSAIVKNIIASPTPVGA